MNAEETELINPPLNHQPLGWWYSFYARKGGIFYDYDAGRAKFEAPAGWIEGELTRKRQFKIQNGVMEYAIEMWGEVPKANVILKSLNKSYRSTYEIMEFAKKSVISHPLKWWNVMGNSLKPYIAKILTVKLFLWLL